MSKDDRPIALVLGAAVWPGERPSPSLKRRAVRAAELFAEGTVSHIIGCGGLGHHPPAEAEMIRRICLDAGVPDTAVLLEDRSTSTLENIEMALPLLESLGCDSVVLVTDRYHAFRAWMVARHFGLTVRVSNPAEGGTPLGRVVWFWLREIPAIAVYALRLSVRF